jgi:hypothetical protein
MSTRTVPHPRWPGGKLSPQVQRIARESARNRRSLTRAGFGATSRLWLATGYLEETTRMLQMELSALRASHQALADEARRANNIAVMG